MKVLIIEPHPDDTSLSAYFIVRHLIEEGHEISLASIANFPETKRSSEMFCNTLGIKFIETQMVEDINLKERISTKEYNSKEQSYVYQAMYYITKYRPKMEEVDKLVKKVISTDNYDKVLTCVGLIHPMHVLVNCSVELSCPTGKVELFLDMPYAFRNYGQKILKDSELTLSKRYVSTKESVDEKLKTFYYCYPTERNILRFDRELYYKERGEEQLYVPYT